MSLSALSRREPLVVLGIDPGTYCMGFGVVGRRGRSLQWVDHGVFRAGRDEEIGARLARLHDGIEQVLDHHRPDVVSLEEAFFLRNAQSALRIGESRALVLLAAAKREVPVIQYPTAVVKKAVCGHGGADKAAVQEMVSRTLDLEAVPEPHDAADGLALALCLLFDPRLDPRLGSAVHG